MTVATSKPERKLKQVELTSSVAQRPPGIPRCRAINGAVIGMEYLGTALANIRNSTDEGDMPASAIASRAAWAASSSCVSAPQTNRSLTPQVSSSHPSGFPISRSRDAELTFFWGRLVPVPRKLNAMEVMADLVPLEALKLQNAPAVATRYRISTACRGSIYDCIHLISDCY